MCKGVKDTRYSYNRFYLDAHILTFYHSFYTIGHWPATLSAYLDASNAAEIKQDGHNDKTLLSRYIRFNFFTLI
jgi:hypothetical protein